MRKILALLMTVVMLLCCAVPTTFADDGKELNIIAAFSRKEKVFEKFTQETGIKINFLEMSSGEVLSRIEAEGGKPVADIWFGGGIDSFTNAAEKGLLEAYASPEAAAIPADLKDSNGYWSSMYICITGFVVNNDVLKTKGLPSPTSWADLADPKYKDELIMSDPSISGTNYLIINSLLQKMGDEKGWAFLKAMGANIPYYGRRGKEPHQKTILGEYAVGLTYVDGGIMALPNDYPVSIVFPEEGIPCAPDGLAIFKNAKNMELAKQFIDWVSSKRMHEFMRDLNDTIMTRSDVEKPKALANVPLDRLMKVDYSLFGKQRDAILEKWQKEVVR